MASMISNVSSQKTHELTPSEEDYIEAMFRLQEKIGEKIKVKELAKNLGVRDPSVVEMLQKLKKKGIVKYDRYGASLTEAGKKHAARILRRHKLAERLLSDVFKHELPGVHEHACEFEHILDDELTDKIDNMLGNPKTCPHGRSIPTREGRTTSFGGKALTKLREGEECMIKVIPEERGCVERLLSLNILPRERVRILEKLPGGAILLQCGGTQVALSRDIASRILVCKFRHRHRRGRRV